MKWFLFDIEVFPDWFCIVVKEYKSKKYGVITSDNLQPLSRLVDLMSISDNVFVGYNIKGYDLHILNLILLEYKNQTQMIDMCYRVFQLSESIVKNGNRNLRFPYNLCTFTDLKDDISDWLSLKEYESNKGMAIVESDVPFGSTNLHIGDKNKVIDYCKHDVDAVESMLEDRWNYVQTKVRLAERFFLNPYDALKRTNPSLVCSILVRERKKERPYLETPISYTLPPQIEQYIKATLPPWLVNMFLDYNNFESANKTFELFENTITVGLGGLHCVHRKNSLDKDGVLFVERRQGFVNVTIDVRSYYPHLICNFNYQSRATTDMSLYPSILKTRMDLKDKLEVEPNPTLKQESDDLKLILVSVGGSLKQEFLPLYDPEMNVRMAFSGQLLLLALCKQLYDTCEAQIIQGNTDGIMMVIPEDKRREAYNAIVAWENITNMKFDIGKFDKVWQSNVNNYVMTREKGKPKICGAWLDYTVDPFHNIQFPIIKKAMFNYLVHGKEVTRTIYEENDPMQFLYTVKRGPTFEATVIRLVNRNVELGKVNRIYASNGAGSGVLYKRKGKSYQLVPNCPQRAKTLNTAVLGLPADLDRDWYVKQAIEAISRLVRIDL